MAWGKEEFRTKCKESNDCLKKIKDNYYDLDYEYQMIENQLQQKENIIKEVREYIMTNGIHSDYGDKGIDDENKLLEILDKGE